jgi:hypothetical protein
MASSERCNSFLPESGIKSAVATHPTNTTATTSRAISHVQNRMLHQAGLYCGEMQRENYVRNRKAASWQGFTFMPSKSDWGFPTVSPVFWDRAGPTTLGWQAIADTEQTSHPLAKSARKPGATSKPGALISSTFSSAGWSARGQTANRLGSGCIAPCSEIAGSTCRRCNSASRCTAS